MSVSRLVKNDSLRTLQPTPVLVPEDLGGFPSSYFTCPQLTVKRSRMQHIPICVHCPDSHSFILPSLPWTPALIHVCAKKFRNKMSSNRFVAESASKPLAGIAMRSLSRENKNSQDEHDMAVLGRAQELNVSMGHHPYTRPRYRPKLIHHSATSVSFRRWGLRAR